MTNNQEPHSFEILTLFWDDLWRRYNEVLSDISFLRNRARNLFLSCAGLQIALLSQLDEWKLGCKNLTLITLVLISDIWLLQSYSGIEKPFSPKDGDYDRSPFLTKIQEDKDLSLDDFRSQILGKEAAVLAYERKSRKFHADYGWMIGVGTMATILTVTLFLKQKYAL